MADLKKQAETLKNQGNQALQNGNIDEAIQLYSDAIKSDPENAALFSNRSAAYCKKGKYMEALTDAETAAQINPKWSKAYSRKGAALAFLNRFEEAKMAYEEGLEIDPSNEQLKQGVLECEEKLTGPSESQPLSNPFSDPLLFQKLESDPRTKEYLQDPSFRAKIEGLQKDPKSLGKHMQDSRIMSALGVLLGIQLETVDPSSHRFSNGTSDTAPEKPKETKKPAENSKNTEEPMEQSNADKDLATEEKDKGNTAYKKKDFETALTHYNKAIELDPTNIVFRNNKAAVYFEQKKYDECIKECEEAVDIGRENRADYVHIAKAFARIGKAYKEKDDLENALKFLNKSLSEHRDSQIARQVQEIAKLKEERERLSYLDPAKAEEEKNKGNEYFKKGDYPAAVKHYSEAIKRNPDDAKIYSNRAACYTKLTAFNEALKDAEMCVQLEPTFLKGHLRKGNALLAMKENSKAAAAFQKALDLDNNCQEAMDGYRKARMEDLGDPEEVRKRAMSNPEVQQILGDPAMQLILQQMQKDPRALQEHLKNPEIAKKIEKLLECGLISIR